MCLEALFKVSVTAITVRLNYLVQQQLINFILTSSLLVLLPHLKCLRSILTVLTSILYDSNLIPIRLLKNVLHFLIHTS